MREMRWVGWRLERMGKSFLFELFLLFLYGFMIGALGGWGIFVLTF